MNSILAILAVCYVTYTFDDGLKDQYTVAYPMLKEAGLKGTFFVIAGKVGDPNGYRSKAERNTPLMTWDDIREMSEAGMEIGSHSFSDIRISKMDHDDIVNDLRRSKETIEAHTGKPCVSFAAPFNAKESKKDGTKSQEAAKEAGMPYMRMTQKSAGGAATAESLNAIVEKQKDKGGWMVFMTHGMTRGYDAWENAEEFRKHLEWVKAQPDVKVGTFAEISEIIERENK